MERKTGFNLEAAVNQYLAQLNENSLLSQEEEDQIADHVFSEVEALENTGLSPEEAFEVSKMRLGKIEMLHEEYQKVKPIQRFIPVLLVGGILFFAINMIENLMEAIMSSSYWAITTFTSIDLTQINSWIHLAFQGVLFTTLITLGFIWFLRFMNQGNSTFRALWPIPVLTLVCQVLKFATQGLAASVISPKLFSTFLLNNAYLMLAYFVIGILFSIWVIVRFRNRELSWG